MSRRTVRPEFLALVSVCAALNLGVGFVVASLKLPFYLDSIGTLVATFLGGVWAGAACGILAVVVGSTYTPTLWAYAPTAFAIAMFASIAIRLGYLKAVWPSVAWGIGLGVVSAIVSAPITTYVWGGVSLSGADALTAFFAATGKTLVDSVVLGGLSTDPVDKAVTSVVALGILRRVPDRWRMRGRSA